MSLFDKFWKKQEPKTDAAAETPEEDFESLDDAMKEPPPRPLLYAFQHVILPEAAFQNHPELIRELATPSAGMPLLHMRSKAYVRCLHTGMIESNDDTETELDELDTLFRGLAIHSYKRNGYTAHVITMPVPQFSPEAYFAAIVHKDGESRVGIQASSSTRYLTLEKSITPVPMFCEWTRDGTHLNFGAGPTPDIAAFVEAVFARIAA